MNHLIDQAICFMKIKILIYKMFLFYNKSHQLFAN